ncbi:MAG: thiamine pyrophosphate-binding protein [Saprospiraceae bacterium]|nr:thiamine pyrophosphate-binding protein [Saprospiraceae bacterium]
MKNNKNTEWNVGRYLASRLESLGVGKIFGVPGNHLGPFLTIMHATTQMEWVGTTNEINGGYAADGYARATGLGVAGVTYGVGALSLINTISGAFVERVPIVVINACPTNEQWLNYQAMGLLTSHMSPNHESNLIAYRQVTASAQVISNSNLATSQIDTALETCLTELRPVYLEIRQNVFESPCSAPKGKIGPRPRPTTERNASVLKDAIEAAVDRIKELGKPILWGGMEIDRFNLADEFQDLSEKTGIGFCTTIMGKSILSENHPNFMGVYNGKASLPEVRKIFNEVAQCRIGLGAWTTSKNLGGTKDLGEDWIKADHEGVSVGATYFPEVKLGDFIVGLKEALLENPKFGKKGLKMDYYKEYFQKTTKAPGFKAHKINKPNKEGIVLNFRNRKTFIESLSGLTPLIKPLTYDSFIKRINQFLKKSMKGSGLNATTPYIAIADAGFSLLSAQNLVMVERNTFHSQASWLAIGYSVGAATGFKEGQPDKRPLVFVGDGSFQETCQALSSHTRLNQDNVIFVFNNNGFYGIEQMLVEPRYYGKGGEQYKDFYNVLHPWNYSKLAEVFGNEDTPMRGFVIRNHQELDDLLEVVKKDKKGCGPILVQVVVPQRDYPKSIGYKVREAE